MRTTLIRIALVMVLAVTAVPMAAPPPVMSAPAEEANNRALPPANYDLASRWTSAKVGKYLFSTAVTPRWLEFSDRFWYEYETPAGKKWWVVDPVKKTRTPLWDNAKMAAQLTRILRTPYDAQHLPIGTIRFFDNDAKVRFSVTLPRDSRVESATGETVYLSSYARQVEDLLGEFKQAARGQFTIEKYDPQPDSDAEDRAKMDGIEGQPIPPYGESFYLGLSLSRGMDEVVAIPFLSPSR